MHALGPNALLDLGLRTGPFGGGIAGFAGFGGAAGKKALTLARLKKEGQAILLVDKHLDALTKIADHHVVIEKGHVVWTGTSAALTADASIKTQYLQV